MDLHVLQHWSETQKWGPLEYKWNDNTLPGSPTSSYVDHKFLIKKKDGNTCSSYIWLTFPLLNLTPSPRSLVTISWNDDHFQWFRWATILNRLHLTEAKADMTCLLVFIFCVRWYFNGTGQTSFKHVSVSDRQ